MLLLGITQPKSKDYQRQLSRQLPEKKARSRETRKQNSIFFVKAIKSIFFVNLSVSIQIVRNPQELKDKIRVHLHGFTDLTSWNRKFSVKKCHVKFFQFNQYEPKQKS